MARKKIQISLRLDERIVRYFDGLVAEYRERWKKEKRVGDPPSRTWFIEQRLGIDAGIDEAVDWKESDDESDN